MTLTEVFNQKRTENGDITFKTTGNHLLDILFMSEYFSKNLDEVTIGKSYKEQLFSMFVRDPRYGLGYRELGRKLMKESGISLSDIIFAGRYDDIWHMFPDGDPKRKEVLDLLKAEIENGNELAKKWMPRYSSKNLLEARSIAAYWGMNKQQYGKFIKCNTVENSLSRKTTDGINFEHVPSLAMIKYFNRFSIGDDTSERFSKYLKDVKAGKKELKVSTTTVYDIYRNMEKIDPDLFFDKIEKIGINCLPVIDTSGSMWDMNDSIGKALSVGHYLAKCSTYAKNKVVSFSSHPQLITLGDKPRVENFYVPECVETMMNSDSKYKQEIGSMYTGDCSNTNLVAVMEMLEDLTDVPEYLVIMSDMQFDNGSRIKKDELMSIWKERGYKTKIVWWNFNSRESCSTPETDEYGNIFMSGYNPYLLTYLEQGFDGNKFLDKLLENYEKNLKENLCN